MNDRGLRVFTKETEMHLSAMGDAVAFAGLHSLGDLPVFREQARFAMKHAEAEIKLLTITPKNDLGRARSWASGKPLQTLRSAFEALAEGATWEQIEEIGPLRARMLVRCVRPTFSQIARLSRDLEVLAAPWALRWWVRLCHLLQEWRRALQRAGVEKTDDAAQWRWKQ